MSDQLRPPFKRNCRIVEHSEEQADHHKRAKCRQAASTAALAFPTASRRTLAMLGITIASMQERNITLAVVVQPWHFERTSGARQRSLLLAGRSTQLFDEQSRQNLALSFALSLVSPSTRQLTFASFSFSLRHAQAGTV